MVKIMKKRFTNRKSLYKLASKKKYKLTLNQTKFLTLSKSLEVSLALLTAKIKRIWFFLYSQYINSIFILYYLFKFTLNRTKKIYSHPKLAIYGE